MSRIELYTPWREPLASLRARHIPRRSLEQRLEDGLRAILSGRSPVPLYLFGPRGTGKSHLLALAKYQAEELGLRTIYVPEDIPALRSADELIERATGRAPNGSWGRWLVGEQTMHAGDLGPTVLIIEGLDRRLAELGPGDAGRTERQKLRGDWAARPLVWVIGAGIELTTAFTDSGEPLFGAFDAEPVGLLTDDEGRVLLDRMVPETVKAQPHWPGRREALIALAGGSPRVLVTLADTCAAPDAPEAATEALLTAVDRFTAHYQLRFRDLPPHGQHIVDALSAAPRELSPGELAAILESSPPSVATQARRLADDGVLLRREDGRATWYRLAEPLFRFWLEYRTAPWADTRVWIATTLLQHLFTPAEIVDRWWVADPDDLAGLAVKVQRSETQREAFERINLELGAALERHDLAYVLTVLQKADELRGRRVVERRALLHFSRQGDIEGLESIANVSKVPHVARAIRLAADLRRRQRRPRELLRDWLAKRPAASANDHDGSLLSRLILDALEDTRGAGKPWELNASEQAQLARVFYLRAAFLVRGRLTTHPPALPPSAFLGVSLGATDPDLGELLDAATVRADPALVEQTLVAYHKPHAARPRARLLRSAQPNRPVLVRPDLLVPWMIADLRATPSIAPLTWARSLADIDGAQFDLFIEALPTSGGAGLVRAGQASRDVEAAMTALGVASPQRLAAVVDAVPPALAPTALRAAALARQMTEASAGRLHPELQRLRDALLTRG